MIDLSSVPRRSGIYKILNRKTGRCYIGSAERLLSRLRCHVSTLRNGKHRSSRLQRSWNKHGEDMFCISIAELVPEKSMLLIREQVWIDCLRSAEPIFGYNICPQAKSALGVKRSSVYKASMSALYKGKPGRPCTEEAKQLLVIAHKRLFMEDPEVRQRILSMKPDTTGSKISEDHIAALRAGHKAKVTGVPKTPEHRAKLAAANTGKKDTVETRKKKHEAAEGRPLPATARANSAEATRKRWDEWRAANGRDKPWREAKFSRAEKRAIKAMNAVKKIGA